jgi:hypothetical protein
MKRLFLSAIALTIGAFAFISCEKEDVDKGKGEKAKPGTFMTVPQQQKAISDAMKGIADAVEFTDFADAIEVAGGIVGRQLSKDDLTTLVVNSPDVFSDSTFLAKMSQAMIMFTGDSIVADLSSLYMSADLYISDSVMIDTVKADTTYQTILKLGNLNYDVDCVQLNIFVDGHKVTLKADAKAGESTFTSITPKKTTEVTLPESIELYVLVDDKSLATVKGEYKSDMKFTVIDGEEEEDSEMSYEGSKINAKGSLKLAGYEVGGSFDLDLTTGVQGSLSAKIQSSEVLSASVRIDANFQDLDVSNDTLILVWAQNPQMLKSISGNASLGGGQVKLVGSLENPFKDEEAAIALRSLMVPGATLTAEKSQKLIEKLNELFKVELFFEGYKDAQAKLKLIYVDPTAKENAGTKGEYDEEDDSSALDAIMELFGRAGAYPVLQVYDEDGSQIEIPVEEYFTKIDLTEAGNIITAKFNAAFGPLMQIVSSDDEED